MKNELRNHAAALGRHGANQRWSKTSADERSRVMELVRKGKAKRAREGKRPQNAAGPYPVRPSSEREELPEHLQWLAVLLDGQSFATFAEAD